MRNLRPAARRFDLDDATGFGEGDDHGFGADDVFSGGDGGLDVVDVEMIGRVDADDIDVGAGDDLAVVVGSMGDGVFGGEALETGLFAVAEGAHLQAVGGVVVDCQHVGAHAEADDAYADIFCHCVSRVGDGLIVTGRRRARRGRGGACMEGQKSLNTSTALPVRIDSQAATPAATDLAPSRTPGDGSLSLSRQSWKWRM